MAEPTGGTQQFLVCVIGDQFYGLPAAAVREVVCPPPVTVLPGRDPALRGVINLRGQVIPLFDLGRRLGLANDTTRCELVALLQAREQDHVRWLDALEQSAATGAAFNLARDPHRCAFGQWYDQFRPQQPELASQMLKFNRPHQRIHAVADEVLKMVAAGHLERAVAVLAATRNGALAQLRRLFTETCALIEHRREVAVVVWVNGQPCALCVDRVEAVETLGRAADHGAPRLLAQAGRMLQLLADPSEWLLAA